MKVDLFSWSDWDELFSTSIRSVESVVDNILCSEGAREGEDKNSRDISDPSMFGKVPRRLSLFTDSGDTASNWILTGAMLLSLPLLAGDRKLLLEGIERMVNDCELSDTLRLINDECRDLGKVAHGLTKMRNSRRCANISRTMEFGIYPSGAQGITGSIMVNSEGSGSISDGLSVWLSSTMPSGAL